MGTWKTARRSAMTTSRLAKVCHRSSFIARTGTVMIVETYPVTSTSKQSAIVPSSVKTVGAPLPPREKALRVSDCHTWVTEIAVQLTMVSAITMSVERTIRCARCARVYCRFSQIRSSGSGAIAACSGPEPEK